MSKSEYANATVPISARLDVLPSAGRSLLDYKRGVPVARPQRGWEAGEGGKRA
jgi:hypothetical protein